MVTVTPAQSGPRAQKVWMTGIPWGRAGGPFVPLSFPTSGACVALPLAGGGQGA